MRARWWRSAPAKSCSPRWTATAPGHGFDIALTRAIADAVTVPVIASGGVGTLDHLVEGIRDGHATRRAGRLDLSFRRIFRARGQGLYGARRPADAARSVTCRGLRQPGSGPHVQAVASPRTGAEMLRNAGHGLVHDHDLEKRVQERAKASAEVSYTRKLLDRGVAHCAKKFGEEAVEAVIAAVGEDRERLIARVRRPLYHLLVVLHARGVTLAEVEAVLGERTRQSGLEEKASRKGG